MSDRQGSEASLRTYLSPCLFGDSGTLGADASSQLRQNAQGPFA
jgi:hypothetical protein